MPDRQQEAEELKSPDADEAAEAIHLGPHPCPGCESENIDIFCIRGVTFAECQNCCHKGPANRIVAHEGADRIGKVRARRQAQGDWNENATKEQ